MRLVFLALSTIFAAASARIAKIQTSTRDPIVSLQGEYNIASGTIFENTTVGGLSGITYDATRNVYYLVSDGPTKSGQQRFYTAEIDIFAVQVRITGVTFFRRANGDAFEAEDLDPEGIQYTDNDTLVMASERDPPAIFEFGLDGKLLRYFFLPPYYLPSGNGTYGTRNNLGFEGLSLSPNGEALWAANEGALAQDGPRASVTEPSLARFVRFDMRTGVPTKELVYLTDRISRAPVPASGFAENGVAEIVSMDDAGEKFLVLERSFAVGARLPDRGYGVRLYLATATARTGDVLGAESIKGMDVAGALHKTLLVDFGRLGIVVDNLEGLQVVQTSCGGATVIVMSDDNFSAFGPQSNQFVFLKLRNV